MRVVLVVLTQLALVVSNISCTTMRASAPSSVDAVTRLEVRAGDTVRLLTKYRQKYTFRVTALDAATMSGETVKLARNDPGSEHEAVKVRYADIALIEVKKKSALRTAAAGLVVIEVVGLVALSIEGVPIGLPGP